MIQEIAGHWIINALERMLDALDIKANVTEKIEAMQVEELEALVMYVMEKELKAVVNLGALIGNVNIFGERKTI
ncbi:MAG: DUF445 family protein [Eubacteriales bacterium]|nr:DUF445 family protein [Eubacteriales bacterium]